MITTSCQGNGKKPLVVGYCACDKAVLGIENRNRTKLQIFFGLGILHLSSDIYCSLRSKGAACENEQEGEKVFHL